MIGRHVIGVLFAADRRARIFEREQIALLGSFAALAAAAIDTANRLWRPAPPSTAWAVPTRSSGTAAE